jgi:hypothetical protein
VPTGSDALSLPSLSSSSELEFDEPPPDSDAEELFPDFDKSSAAASETEDEGSDRISAGNAPSVSASVLSPLFSALP